MVTQQCLVLIKPDGIIKSINGHIISSLSESKLKIVGAKMVRPSKELAEMHYSELAQSLEKRFGKEKGVKVFDSVLKYIMGHYHTDRVMALVYYGEDAIAKIRALAGSTNPEDADPVTIRGKFGRINSKTQVFENVVHVSDSEESARREIELWFQPEELTDVIFPTKKEKVSVQKIAWE